MGLVIQTHPVPSTHTKCVKKVESIRLSLGLNIKAQINDCRHEQKTVELLGEILYNAKTSCGKMI